MNRSSSGRRKARATTKIMVTILLVLSSIEIIPYVVTALIPDACYGCTSLGKLQQYLNSTIKLSCINWFAYLVLFLYFIYRISQWKDSVTKFAAILLCLFMIYLPGYPLLNLISFFMSSVYTNPSFLHDYHKLFPSSVEIERRADQIVREFNKYNAKTKTECVRKTNPGFKIETTVDDENCWRGVYLKKAGRLDHSMRPFFPTTMALLEDAQIHNAFFSILDPGVEIPEHVGYYKGYLRYHLGILIPNSDTGGVDDKAYIVCGGEKYFWKEKKGIVFDDMYSHYVKNPTDQQRVVLYLDVKRRNESSVLNAVNDAGIWLIENSVLLQYYLKNQHNQTKIKNV